MIGKLSTKTAKRIISRFPIQSVVATGFFVVTNRELHFSMSSSFSTRSTISRRSSTTASNSVIASLARSCGSGSSSLSSSDSSLSQVMSSLYSRSLICLMSKQRKRSASVRLLRPFGSAPYAFSNSAKCCDCDSVRSGLWQRPQTGKFQVFRKR